MATATPMKDASGPGTVLAARYRVIERLGEGGMGVVYRVLDTASDEEVALKTLQLRTGGSDRPLLLFKTEFWAMTRLRHPNLPEVHDFGSLDDGTPYFTMELVGGGDLAKRVPLSLHVFYDVFTQLAQALSFIHARRLIHRDVKASNVRLVPDEHGFRVVLMDFGLVSALGETSSRATISGTAAYLAPEASHGGVLDARADLFSLGILAVEALTGRLPKRYAQGTAPASVAASGSHVDLSGLSGFPPGLVRLIRRLVADAPSRRPPSADLVVETLVSLGGGDDPRTATAQKRSYLATSSLVGRDAELARLRASLDGAREGRGGVVLVSGPAGVGKSRLLREFRVEALLQGAAWAAGGCRPQGASPLQPVLEAIAPFLPTLARDADSSLRRHAPALLPVLPALQRVLAGIEAAPPLLDPAAEAERLLDAAIGLLEGLAERQPVVVAVDDLQWADGTTLRLVERLLRSAGGNGKVLLLGTLRSDELATAPALAALVDTHRRAVMKLAAFDSSMIRALLAEQFGIDDVVPEVVDALWRRTGGNAFFLHELLRYMVDEDLVRFSAGRWRMPESLRGVPLPSQLEDILERRLDARSPAEVGLLEVFAAAARPLDLWLLARLADPEPAAEGDALFARVDALRVHDLIAVDGEVLDVRHDRILEFAYDRMPAPRRAELHARIARVMAEANTSDPERYAFPDGEIGRQFVAGGLPADAAGHLLAGSERAFRVQALDEAIGLLEDAEETLVDLGETAIGSRMDRVQDLLLRSVYALSPTRAVPIAERTIQRYRELGWMDRIPTLRRRYGVLGLIAGLVASLIAARRRHGLGKRAFLDLFRRFLVAQTWRSTGLAWASRHDESIAAAEEIALYVPPRSAGSVAALLAANGALLFSGRLAEQQRRLNAAYELLRGKAGGQFPPFDRRVAVRGAVGGGLARAAGWESDPDTLRWLELEDGIEDDIDPIILEGVSALVRVSFHATRGEARAMDAEFRRYLAGRALVRPEEREEMEHWIAWAAVDRGEHERARDLAGGFVHRGPLSEAWAGLIRARLPGAPLTRIAAAEGAVAAATRAGSASVAVASLARLVLSDAHRDAGGSARARELAQDVLGVCREEGTRLPLVEMMAMRRVSRGWLAEGHAEGAATVATDALELATAHKNPIERGFALQARAAADAAALRHADADRWCTAAAVEFEQLDNEHQLRRLRDLARDAGFTGSRTATFTLGGGLGELAVLPAATARALTSSLDVEEVAQALLDVLETRLDEVPCAIFLRAADRRAVRVLALDEGGEVLDAPEAIPLSVLQLCDDEARTRADLIPLKDGGWLLPLRTSRSDDEGAETAAPSAAVYVTGGEGAASEGSVRDLRGVLDVGGAAIGNALRHEAIAQREHRLLLTNQLAQVLGAVRDSNDLLTVILDRMLDLGRADRAFIMLRDADTGELEFEAARDLARRDTSRGPTSPSPAS